MNDLRGRALKLVKALGSGLQLREAMEQAGLNEGEKELAISYLLAEGYIVDMEAGCECICSKCPLKSICRAPVRVSGRTYVIVREPGSLGVVR